MFLVVSCGSEVTLMKVVRLEQRVFPYGSHVLEYQNRRRSCSAGWTLVHDDTFAEA